MDKDTQDFLNEVGEKATENPKALFFAEAVAGISGLYVGFIDKAFRQDKNIAVLLMSMVNSGVIRANSNSTDEAIETINEVADMMRDMVIKLEKAVNGLDSGKLGE
jgi:hypothetical protein